MELGDFIKETTRDLEQINKDIRRLISETKSKEDLNGVRLEMFYIEFKLLLKNMRKLVKLFNKHEEESHKK